jgi:hypothetical protein
LDGNPQVAHQRSALVACRTAFTGTTKLIDEIIHLATPFQLAGYSHIIGRPSA